MDYASAVNVEIKALFAAGVDVVQLDEPYMQARPEKAAEYAIKAINRALDGVGGTTAVHLCFGYAHIVHERPSTGYSFLSELEACSADQISIEGAQSELDPTILTALPSKTIIWGVINLGDPQIESPETVAKRIRRGLKVLPPERMVVAPDCGMKYISRDIGFGKLCAMVAGAHIVRKELGL